MKRINLLIIGIISIFYPLMPAMAQEGNLKNTTQTTIVNCPQGYATIVEQSAHQTIISCILADNDEGEEQEEGGEVLPASTSKLLLKEGEEDISSPLGTIGFEAFQERSQTLTSTGVGVEFELGNFSLEANHSWNITSENEYYPEYEVRVKYEADF